MSQVKMKCKMREQSELRSSAWLLCMLDEDRCYPPVLSSMAGNFRGYEKSLPPPNLHEIECE